MDLFNKPPVPPLADRMRPARFEDFVGQEEVVEPIRRILASRAPLPSMILWGPPGSGKTTLARLIAKESGLEFVQFSAVISGIAEVREVIKRAKARSGKLMLFVDEIHRFNRAQQDAFLPYVEDGTIVLVGATTENPSFQLNTPLLSRCRVFRLRALTDPEVATIVGRASRKQFAAEAMDFIVNMANGDARVALNLLELSEGMGAQEPIGLDVVKQAAPSRIKAYDKDREEHYNLISAFIKSMRGSDPDAAVYWLARMLESGEDPVFVARRLVIFASEDIGNADPRALMIAVAAKEAVEFIGMPEAVLPLSQATTYLACAPKSNASYIAYLKAAEDVEKTRNEPVPLHLRNAVTRLMRNLGYGKGYKYAHDFEGGVVEQQHLPDNLKGRVYYEPTREPEQQRRLDEIKKRRNILAE